MLAGTKDFAAHKKKVVTLLALAWFFFVVEGVCRKCVISGHVVRIPGMNSSLWGAVLGSAVLGLGGSIL